MYFGHGYYGYGMGSGYILVLIAFLFSMVAQAKVSSTFNKYSRVRNRAGFTGAQVAAQMLQNAGIYDVSVQRVAGNLTDHYDPRTKTLRLSQSVYDSMSVAALGVAAHETGHAIQHDVGYAPLALRSWLVPLANFGSRLAMPLIIIGFLITSMIGFGGNTLITLGILFFSLSVAFTLVTLPVEFNASHRAIDRLVDDGFLTSDEIGGAKKVLSAAAMTYVAAAFAAVAQLLRLVAIFGRRND
ncbi:MAG: zinc metallopeptidase [Anaerotignum sp.]|nr:zinc metallopeptidase [Anaerotignum sp.]